MLLSRAVVIGQIHGPAAALTEIDALGSALARYHLYHAARASFLRRLDRTIEAADADTEAIRFTANAAERAAISKRLGPDGC